jgi:hypothetical protein
MINEMLRQNCSTLNSLTKSLQVAGILRRSNATDASLLKGWSDKNSGRTAAECRAQCTKLTTMLD